MLLNHRMVMFLLIGGWCKSSMNTTAGHARYQGTCGRITVDLNGASGPNTDGRDVF